MLTVYLDVLSIDCLMALEPTLALAEDTGCELRLRPIRLGRSGSFWLVGEDGMSSEPESRGARHKAARKRHLRMNAERYAQRLGYTVVALDRSWNPDLFNQAFLYAASVDAAPGFLRTVFPAFWRGELDIESTAALSATLATVGAPDFGAFLAGPASAQLAAAQAESDQAGVIDSPAYFLDGEAFFGRSHLPTLRDQLLSA